MTDEELEELSGELSEMFSEFVRVEVHNEGREHGVSLPRLRRNRAAE